MPVAWTVEYFSDLPSALRAAEEFPGVTQVIPDEPILPLPYAYAVPHGDQIWLNYVNQFVATMKLTGKLAGYADKHGLGPMMVD